MQDNPLIDFEFTLSQLSGNQELAIKMLNRFKEEYADAEQRIGAFLQAQDQTSAKQLVHTLKGVSGNLGIKALHSASKELEDSIRDQQNIDVQFTAFKQTLQETIGEVDRISNGDTSEPQSNAKATSQDTHSTLVTLLKRNEFIPTEKLEELVADLEISDEEKQVLKTAVDDLDYEQALALLN